MSPSAILLLPALILSVDAFSLLSPAIRLSPADRRALSDGRTIAKTLASPDDQVGVFAISPVSVPANSLIEHARAIEDLKRSRFVIAVQRFSDPPRMEDLAGLVLTQRDLDAAMACRPQNCSFKLTEAEMTLLHDSASEGDGDRPARYQRAFKKVLLSRATAYLEAGLRALPPVANRETPACLDRAFNDILSASPPLSDVPCAAEWLRSDPSESREVASALYWSYETYGAGKPVVTITHLGLVPANAPGQPALVIGKQVFASRYMTGSLAVTAIVTDAATRQNYLVYVNRTGVDLLGGFLGPIKRAVLESRLKGQVPEIIAKLRTRLERDGATR